jgi:hypothetical protein
VSFALSTPVVVVEFDASLDGVNASEKALGVSLQHLTRFNARFIPLLHEVVWTASKARLRKERGERTLAASL